MGTPLLAALVRSLADRYAPDGAEPSRKVAAFNTARPVSCVCEYCPEDPCVPATADAAMAPNNSVAPINATDRVRLRCPMCSSVLSVGHIDHSPNCDDGT